MAKTKSDHYDAYEALIAYGFSAVKALEIALDKAPGMNWSDPSKRGQDFTRLAGKHAASMRPPAKVSAQPPAEGRKGAGAGAEWFDQNISSLPSSSPRRKAASAMIAKIPEPLSRHIARTFYPKELAA